MLCWLSSPLHVSIIYVCAYCPPPPPPDRDQGFKGGILFAICGIAMHYGFLPMRNNDCFVVTSLGVEVSWAAAVRKYYDSDDYLIYGDSIFAMTMWMQRPYINTVRDSMQQNRNANMAVVRIPNEWHFGNQAGKIKFVGRLGRNQIMDQPVEVFLSVANFVHNCMVCLYGSQTEAYFDCPAPSLEQHCGTASHLEKPTFPGPREAQDSSSSSSDSD